MRRFFLLQAILLDLNSRSLDLDPRTVELLQTLYSEARSSLEELKNFSIQSCDRDTIEEAMGYLLEIKRLKQFLLKTDQKDPEANQISKTEMRSIIDAHLRCSDFTRRYLECLPQKQNVDELSLQEVAQKLDMCQVSSVRFHCF